MSLDLFINFILFLFVCADIYIFFFLGDRYNARSFVLFPHAPFSLQLFQLNKNVHSESQYTPSYTSKTHHLFIRYLEIKYTP